MKEVNNLPAFNVNYNSSLSTKQAAKFLNVQEASVLSWINKGWMIYHKSGANIRIKTHYLKWFKIYKLPQLKKGAYKQDTQRLRTDVNKKRGLIW